MIEINLLPGDGKKKRRAQTSKGLKFEIRPAEIFASLAAKITDKYMLGAIAAAGVSGALIILMFVHQAAKASGLEARETKAVNDSAQFGAVLSAKAKAESSRDSLYQQIAIIKSIDDSRYLWSHLMYEISNALPQYTWLTEITQTSAPRSAAAADTSKKVAVVDSTLSPQKRAAERNRAVKARSDSLLAAAKELKFKIVGHTVDIQALTRFMKSLEASPFIQNVQLSRSDLVQSEGKEVTEFTLEAETQSPPPFAIKTVPLVVSAVH
ncbi:MAG TPA: PilN domain-containing protein [Gemmatimonadaceae bacterium]|nr:PilN domain-containing protein [Gemmatimonadaceae bacterium]